MWPRMKFSRILSGCPAGARGGCMDFLHNKKVLEAKPQGRTSQTPWYHLGSRAPSQGRPLRVPAHSCAVTCAHVVTYAPGDGRPRNSKTMFGKLFRAPFHQAGALCGGTARLLFSSSSFPYEIVVIWIVVYTLPLFLSTDEMDREMDWKIWLFVENNQSCRAGVQERRAVRC